MSKEPKKFYVALEESWFSMTRPGFRAFLVSGSQGNTCDLRYATQIKRAPHWDSILFTPLDWSAEDYAQTLSELDAGQKLSMRTWSFGSGRRYHRGGRGEREGNPVDRDREILLRDQWFGVLPHAHVVKWNRAVVVVGPKERPHARNDWDTTVTTSKDGRFRIERKGWGPGARPIIVLFADGRRLSSDFDTVADAKLFVADGRAG